MIEADPDLLDSISYELDRIADEISGQRAKLRAAGDQTASAWLSNHTASFLGNTETTERRISVSVREMRDLADELRYIAAAVRKTEAKVKEQSEDE